MISKSLLVSVMSCPLTESEQPLFMQNAKSLLVDLLWDKVIYHANTIIPWWKFGVSNNINKSFEFISVIEASGFMENCLYGQKFTWSNQRVSASEILKRLDWVMVNDRCLEIMPRTTITHLP
ncbi:hypothetical protein H5410_061602 [Solanum commersonii]|uniref:Uncharacterized protein n=1 Tax=Solanum commersonii TaxID=4109 RepID=A0A9J5W9B6_SOLCO|nr:hypothetical protein H5410_061602 [Solanum commersonii]